MHTIQEFETALLAHNVEIEEIKQDKHLVKYAKGVIKIDEKRIQSLQWNKEGLCYSKYVNRVPTYDLNLPNHEVKD